MNITVEVTVKNDFRAGGNREFLGKWLEWYCGLLVIDSARIEEFFLRRFLTQPMTGKIHHTVCGPSEESIDLEFKLGKAF